MELGFDVNGQADRPSPLHYAALAGQLDTVNCSSNWGRTAHARDPHYDGTPLSAANYKGQRDVIEYLLQFAHLRRHRARGTRSGAHAAA